MRKIGLFEAKTHFSALIDDVRNGETIVITKNGAPVARIVPESSTDREVGFAREEVWIADDFDAPLPEEIVASFYGPEKAFRDPKPRRTSP